MKRAVIIFLCFIALLMICFFSFRNQFLAHYVNNKLNDFNSKHHSEVNIGSAKFSGIRGLSITNIKVGEKGRESLFTAETLFVSFRIMPLFVGDISFTEIHLANSHLNIISKGDTVNYSFLLSKGDSSETGESSYHKKIKTFTDLFFEKTPENLVVNNMKLSLERDSLEIKGNIKEAQNNYGKLNARIDAQGETWHLSGSMDRDEHSFNLKILPAKRNKQALPILKEQYGITLAFDSAYFALDEERVSEAIFLKTSAKCYGTKMHHWRISPEDVLVKFVSLNAIVELMDRQIHIDSNTVLTINTLPVNLKGYYNVGKKKLGFSAGFKDVEANDFFNSLPDGLFNNLTGITTKGKLTYSLNFDLPYKKPDSLHFSSSLQKKDFGIIKYGNTNLSMLNSDFTYTAYEKGNPVRSFIVGNANAMFTPLYDISEYLKMSVLTSEDGAFFYHRGFNEEAFSKSIAANIKEKRFVRGGSTVSMQLIKNVFLTRNKTISRKIEEALIVWLIENNRLVSKDRMLEVYLNIIEWGPGVYGIGEASEYYFSKKPSQLSLEESIFLAMIVPRPKAFRYHFVDGKIRPHTADYFNVIARHLVMKNVITEEQKLNLKYDVELKGRAKNLLSPKAETIVIPFDEEEEE